MGSVFGCCDPNAVARPALSGHPAGSDRTYNVTRGANRPLEKLDEDQ